MNNKRQTIWLVSMLSLMVILSAYYLFTEDVTQPDRTAQEQKLGTDATGVTGSAQDDGIEITSVDGAGGLSDDGAAAASGGDKSASVDGGTATGKEAAASPDALAAPSKETAASPGASAGTDKATSASPDAGKDGQSAGSPADKEVLKGMNNLSAREQFDQIQLEREQAASKAYEDLDKIVADSSKSQEEAASAVEEQGRITATEERIASLQDKLVSDYENAVVKQEGGKFEIIVQADALDSKQAVKIVKLATKELSVTPDAVSVQFIQ
ncbi:SpoIIIAH-like family protein [Cohnella hashimotonis]|uniref:SpoIIIAH-like family protein n=1 Tax=Cohnella hashimotonis TaxID=2826895 RepID=A0ABT6TEW8_9BACL|nr:SpoIIIAH-like family protein [Cohnella hashimotonis]MDI4645356.1 SpoIIIAH-like family protein [Cohnella hashimotonis]